MAIEMFDTVVLLKDLMEFGLKKGDTGAVVEIYSDNALEIEFIDESGKTTALATINAGDVRVVSRANPASL